jgi:hypothetical protein
MPLRIEHRIGVAAPAEVIWELVFNVEGWPAWNPMYPEAKGRVAIGDTLQLTEKFDGWKTRQIQPVIVDWEPNNQIVWRAGGLFMRCVRYIEIEALSETGCIFANGAFFHGLVGEREARTHRRPIHAAYAGFGETVKRLAEQAWQERAAVGPAVG